MAFKMKGSPFKQTSDTTKADIKKATVNAARQMLKQRGINDPNMSDAEVVRSAKVKNVYKEASSKAKQAIGKGVEAYGYKG